MIARTRELIGQEEAVRDRTATIVRKLGDRIRALTAARDSSEGDARAALDQEIEQARTELTKDEDGSPGGYRDELTGANDRISRLRKYIEKVKGALTLNRPGLRAKTKAKIQELRQAQFQNGRWIDANTKKAIIDKVVFGHKPGFEHWRLSIQAVEKGLTQAQFNDWVNEHPEWFQIESKAENESHAHENHED